jgi:hypothetical protein
MVQAEVAALAPRRPRFNTRPILAGFVIDKVALGQGFLSVLLFSPVSFHQCSILVHSLPPTLYNLRY